MENIILTSVFAYSIYWFLNYSSLTAGIRNWISSKENLMSTNIQVEKYPKLKELYECPYCLGFHIGWMVSWVFNGYLDLWTIGIGFIVAILCYFIALIEKLLIKHL